MITANLFASTQLQRLGRLDCLPSWLARLVHRLTMALASLRKPASRVGSLEQSAITQTRMDASGVTHLSLHRTELGPASYGRLMTSSRTWCYRPKTVAGAFTGSRTPRPSGLRKTLFACAIAFCRSLSDGTPRSLSSSQPSLGVRDDIQTGLRAGTGDGEGTHRLTLAAGTLYAGFAKNSRGF